MQLLVQSTSLIIVDAQCGFTPLCPDELPIPDGLNIVPQMNRLLDLPWRRIDATQDWHPPKHCSFFGQRDNLYPPHCIMNTRGAEFLPGLTTERFQTVWRKGFHVDRDAYAVTLDHPAFPQFLRLDGIDTVVIAGLARNICCFATARDLRAADFRVILVEDASAGIDLPELGILEEHTRTEAAQLGISYATTAEIRAAVRDA